MLFPSVVQFSWIEMLRIYRFGFLISLFIVSFTKNIDSLSAQNLLRCHKTRDLYEIGTNDTYLKSYCIINEHANQRKASNSCVSNNMKLFVINSAEVEAALFAGISAFGFGPGSSLWINKNSSGYIRSSAKYCLRYANDKNHYWKPSPLNCSQLHWYICEFYEKKLWFILFWC